MVRVVLNGYVLIVESYCWIFCGFMSVWSEKSYRCFSGDTVCLFCVDLLHLSEGVADVSYDSAKCIQCCPRIIRSAV